jgi:hypothetical protein
MRERLLTAAAVLAVPALAAAQVVKLGPEIQVNTYTTDQQRRPSVAVDAAGNFVVVWQSFGEDGNGEGVFGRRYDPSGVPRGPAFLVNTSTTQSQSVPDVASDPSGNFVVVWTGQIHPVFGTEIFAQRYDASGAAQGANFVVNTYTTGIQHGPAVTMDATGRFVVAWESVGQDGSEGAILYRPFDAAGNPAFDPLRANTYTTGHQLRPAIGSEPGGNFVIAWQSAGEDGSANGVFARWFNRTTFASSPQVRMNAYTTGEQQIPSVAAGLSGDFLVAWQSTGQDGSVDGVFARKFNGPTITLGAEFPVNTFTSSNQSAPSVSSDAGGNFVVVWSGNQDPEASTGGVHGRRFDATGAPIEGDFHVNTYTTGRQNAGVVAAVPNGTFVVAWESSDQMGGTYEISAQRLGPDLIFADDFESGDTSRWSAAMTDGGDLTVSGAAALGGTLSGLQGVVDDAAGIFVVDESPLNEDRYRARFYFDTNGFDPGEAQGRFRTRLLLVLEEAPVRRLAAVVLRRQLGAYSLMGRARRDDNSQANTGFFAIVPGDHFVEIDWRRSSGPDASDGSFEMFIDGTSVSLLTGLDNSLSSVDLVRLGALSVKAGASGTLFWDEFVSRRTTYIGP